MVNDESTLDVHVRVPNMGACNAYAPDIVIKCNPMYVM